MGWRDDSTNQQSTAIISRNRNLMDGIGKILWKDKHMSIMKDNHLKDLGYMVSIIAHQTHFHHFSLLTVESALLMLWSNPWKASKDNKGLLWVGSLVFFFAEDPNCLGFSLLFLVPVSDS